MWKNMCIFWITLCIHVSNSIHTLYWFDPLNFCRQIVTSHHLVPDIQTPVQCVKYHHLLDFIYALIIYNINL